MKNNNKSLKTKHEVKGVRTYISLIIGAMLIYFIGYNLPLFGISNDVLESIGGTDVMTYYISLLTGGSLSSLTLFTLGMAPIITGTIIVQLLESELSKTVKSWREQGKAGRKNKLKLQYIITAAISVILSLGGVIMLLSSSTDLFRFGTVVTLIIIPLQLTAASCGLLFLSKKIDEVLYGIGTSLLLTTGIILTMIDALSFDMFTSTQLLITGVFFITVTIMIMLVNLSSIEFKGTSYLYNNLEDKDSVPFRLSFSQTGVTALIYTMPVIVFLNWVVGKFEIENEIIANLFNLSDANIVTIIVFFLTILLFSVLYTIIALDGDDLSDILIKHGYYIYDVNPGEDTAKLLNSVIIKIGLIGGFMIATVASLPYLISLVITLPGVALIISTSLIIILNTALNVFRVITTNIKSV